MVVFRRIAVSVVLIVAVAASVLLADGSLFGTLSGRVRDESGGALPGASVTLTSVEKGFQRTGVTDATGTFNFALLPPGSYSIKVEISGFEGYTSTGNLVAPEKTTSLAVALKLSRAEASVTVSGDAPLVDKTNISDTTTVPCRAHRQAADRAGVPERRGLRAGPERHRRRRQPERARRAGLGQRLSLRRRRHDRPDDGNVRSQQQLRHDPGDRRLERGRVRGVRPFPGRRRQRGDEDGHQPVPRNRSRPRDERLVERREQGHQLVERTAFRAREDRRERVQLLLHARRACLEGPDLLLRRLPAQPASRRGGADADVVDAAGRHRPELLADADLCRLAGQVDRADHAVAVADVLRAGGPVQRHRPRLLGRRGRHRGPDRAEPVGKLFVGLHLAGALHGRLRLERLGRGDVRRTARRHRPGTVSG